jgi:O-antigen/teichoic acid export membrane protein
MLDAGPRPTAAPETGPLSAPTDIGARRTSFDIAVQIVGRVGNLALGVVVTLVLVRNLGGARFGQWSTIFAISQIAANFGELGLAQVAVRHAAAEPERDSDWLSALVSLRLILAVPIALASAVAAYLIVPTHAGKIAGLLVSGGMLLGAPAAIVAVFQLRVRNDISTGLMTLNSLIWAGAVLIVAALSGSLLAFAATFVAVSALTNAVTVVTAMRFVKVRLRGTSAYWRELARVGIAVGAAGILVTFYVKLDQILVLEFAGSRDAGLYGVAYRILDQVQFIPISVATTLFPLIAASYPRDILRVRRLMQSMAEYLTIASLPILAFTIVAARPIMRVLFGSQFAAAAPALPILMGAFVCVSFGYLSGNMVVILGLQRRFLRNAALALVLNAGLNILLIPRYGFLAAAWITLVTEIFVTGLTMLAVVRKLEMRPQFARFARTALAAATMAGLVALGRVLGVPFGGLVAVAAVGYAAAVWLLRVITIEEVRTVIHDRGNSSDAPAETAVDAP